MSDGVAPHVEPAATACAVYPTLGEPTFGIRTNEDKLAPFFIADFVAIFWVGNTSFGSVMELGFITRSTPWTRNVEHLNLL